MLLLIDDVRYFISTFGSTCNQGLSRLNLIWVIMWIRSVVMHCCSRKSFVSSFCLFRVKLLPLFVRWLWLSVGLCSIFCIYNIIKSIYISHAQINFSCHDISRASYFVLWEHCSRSFLLIIKFCRGRYCSLYLNCSICLLMRLIHIYFWFGCILCYRSIHCATLLCLLFENLNRFQSKHKWPLTFIARELFVWYASYIRN